ncbi:MAG: hypothetical protein OEV99_14695 [Nitrospira sp.]|nr:hypothetical protein [Nitrospira sp.]MDH4371071.1 hypothetical protein [Nitrospira sp.]MDH5498011.1 hypothetical protein [Nitrospira sp.]MDH5726534.1 hypothetical protein [Nitrospira sp.]
MNIIDSFTFTRLFIMAVRRFLGPVALVCSCAALLPSVIFGAELFPYAPPSPSQPRSIEQQPPARAQLSADDLDRIAKIAAQARALDFSKKQQLKQSIQNNLDDARTNKRFNQVAYFTQLLRALD